MYVLHVCIHTYMHTYIHTYTHTHTHTHTHVHTYIHTYNVFMCLSSCRRWASGKISKRSTRSSLNTTWICLVPTFFFCSPKNICSEPICTFTHRSDFHRCTHIGAVRAWVSECVRMCKCACVRTCVLVCVCVCVYVCVCVCVHTGICMCIFYDAAHCSAGCHDVSAFLSECFTGILDEHF